MAPKPHPSETRTLRRRALLLGLPSTGLAALACRAGEAPPSRTQRADVTAAPKPVHAAPGAVLERFALGAPPWKTFDPFLFCVHHDDAYPPGNDKLGPSASLAGRDIGQDFAGKDGWRMYHGDVVPGFPRHPHRGFETVTVTRNGFIDHSDSLGATARYGAGDVQWLTAGRGIVHAEMFPLLNAGAQNRTELFQIWLNLPRARKFVDPYFSMFWRSAVPRHTVLDAGGRATEVTITAGALPGAAAPPAPPPNSWGAVADAELAIWTLKLAPRAHFRLPPVGSHTARTLYGFRGGGLHVAGTELPVGTAARLRPGTAVELSNGELESELLLLQGRPIGEPVVARGPFVMNTESEIAEAYRDYRRDEFGGWPWPNSAPVHPRDKRHFAVHADGRKENAS